MRSPRLVFAAVTLTACLFIDGMLGAFPGTLLVNHSSAGPQKMFASADLPEPLTQAGGLVFGDLEQARARCLAQHQRLPSVAETSAWAIKHGAIQSNGPNGAPNLNADNFTYPPKRPIINAAIWTEDVNVPGRHAFSLYEAKYSPVTPSAMLAIVCVDPT